MTVDAQTPTTDDAGSVPSVTRAIGAGLLAGAAALAAGEFAASFFSPRPGPVIAVTNRVIDEAPGWFVNFGKEIFGLADKPALIAGTIVMSLLFGAALGIAARRRRAIGVAGIAAFGAFGLWAMGVDARGGWGYAALVAAVAVVAGVLALVGLLGGTLQAVDADGRQTSDSLPRRTFLARAGGVAATAAAFFAVSRFQRTGASVDAARESVDLEPVEGSDEIAAAVATAESGDVASTPGVSDLITPNDDFYLIDTATLTPQVDPANWSLTIKGMVDEERTYTYQDLLDRATTIVPVTLSCVSNEVGGGLVGNAVWQGVPLTDLLDEAGVQEGATQIRSASVDGWDCGFPTEAAYDGRTAIVAVGMNGEALPVDHGFPARLVVAGLYGYVSATKWLQEIELTTLESFDGYWIPRGWSKLGPIKTQSRIDTPGSGDRLTAGQVPIAGVAWAPDRGISNVEVQVDDGAWMEATLGESLGPNAWVQWLVPWSATPGTHRLRVRATDGDGNTQTESLAPPAPDGATGWHTIDVDVA